MEYKMFGTCTHFRWREFPNYNFFHSQLNLKKKQSQYLNIWGLFSPAIDPTLSLQSNSTVYPKATYGHVCVTPFLLKRSRKGSTFLQSHLFFTALFSPSGVAQFPQRKLAKSNQLFCDAMENCFQWRRGWNGVSMEEEKQNPTKHLFRGIAQCDINISFKN